MFKFILGNIGYFIVMGILLLCFVLVEGPLAGKIGCLGIMSLAMGPPVAKQTRFGLIDKRYKEKSFIWWQVIVGIALLAIAMILAN